MAAKYKGSITIQPLQINNITMTHIKQFIKDAIEGGWEYAQGRKLMVVNGDLFLIDTVNPPFGVTRNTTEPINNHTIATFLLDKDAWTAVGKTRGWYVNTKCREDHSLNYEGTCMMFAWHHFIDHLAEGKSIEEALAAISQ